MCISIKRAYRCGHVFRETKVNHCVRQELNLGRDCPLDEEEITVHAVCARCLAKRRVDYEEASETESEDSGDEDEGETQQSPELQSPLQPAVPQPSSFHRIAPQQQLMPYQNSATPPPMSPSQQLAPHQAVEPQMYDTLQWIQSLTPHDFELGMFDPNLPTTPELGFQNFDPHLHTQQFASQPSVPGPSAAAPLASHWPGRQQNVAQPWPPRTTASLHHEMAPETTLPGTDSPGLGFQETGEPSRKRRHM